MKVYIIGAGPGNTGLITKRGAEALAMADAILYDRLAGSELLSLCRPDAEMIYVGKKSGFHTVSQANIEKLIIDKAREGKIVARLKGGDPYIFGRGSEEALALAEAGIPFEVIPGITSALGAAAFAGIPLTHRNLAVQCMFITAHESDKNAKKVEWDKLAKLDNTTLVLYMGVETIGDTAKMLIEGGMPPSMPAAAIENATMPTQRVIVTILKDLAVNVIKNGMVSPLLFIIGPTADLHEKIDWYDGLPLHNKRIVITRPKYQSATLAAKISELGAEVVTFPVIKTVISGSDNELRKLLADNIFDWIIFTSENGVRYFFEHLKNAGLDARVLGNTKIATVGTSTAAKLESYSLIADFIPLEFTSANLAVAMKKNFELKGNRILRIRGDFGSDSLSGSLEEAGAMVSSYVVYSLKPEEYDPEVIDSAFSRDCHAFVFTSKSTVEGFFDILGELRAHGMLSASKVIAIGPVTADALKERKITDLIICRTSTDDGIIQELKDMVW